jgi:hypothetical protein
VRTNRGGRTEAERGIVRERQRERDKQAQREWRGEASGQAASGRRELHCSSLARRTAAEPEHLHTPLD